VSQRSDGVFERQLTAALVDDAGRAPEAVLARVLGQTEHIRPLPQVFAVLAEPAMVMPERVVVGVRRSRVLLVAAAALLLLMGLIAAASLRQSPPDDAWTTLGGAPSRSATGLTGPVWTPRQRWTFQAGAAVQTTPVIVGDVALVGSDDGILHALDLRSGRRRWAVDVGPGAGGPTVVDGRILFVGGDGSVRALQLVEGSEAWSAAVGAMPAVDLAAVEGTAWAATEAGEIVALETGSGRERWRAAVPNAGPASPIAGVAVSDRLLVATVGSVGAVGLDRATGTVAWSAPADGEQLGVPTIAGDLVWAGPGEDVKVGGLSALRLADGARIWHLDEPFAAPVVLGDTAVTTAASTIGVVTGRDAATGAERWRFGPGGYFLQVAIAGDVAYVLSHTQRQVYGLDVATGRVLWQVPLDAEPGCCLAVARGTLVVATSSGTVTAYEDGEPGGGPTTSFTSLPASPAASAADSAAPSTPSPANPIPFPLSVTDRFDSASLGLDAPISVGMAANGDFYVTDSLHRVSQFGPDGALVRRWGSQGEGPGEFDFGTVTTAIGQRGPLAVGSDGLVYVSDVENHRVQAFAPDGVFLRSFGSLGSGPGQFTIPFDLNADAVGNVYVTDDGAQRITKFSASGAVLWIADQTTDARLLGHAHTPSFDSAGTLVVAIDDSATIVHLDPATGRVIRSISGGGCQAPADAWDRIYVVDCVAGTIRVLDAAGGELARSREMAVAELRLLPDGRGIALGRDGSILILQVTPP
jgi:outer membrane protein assembly factor BamB